MPSPYIYIWTYLVREEHVQDFVREYGPDGAWVKLFRTARGYLSTELLRDRTNPRRFVTIDRWKSREAFDIFRADNASEFEAIDRHCEQYTLEEKQIGLFEQS